MPNTALENGKATDALEHFMISHWLINGFLGRWMPGRGLMQSPSTVMQWLPQWWATLQKITIMRSALEKGHHSKYCHCQLTDRHNKMKDYGIIIARGHQSESCMWLRQNGVTKIFIRRVFWFSRAATGNGKLSQIHPVDSWFTNDVNTLACTTRLTYIEHD